MPRKRPEPRHPRSDSGQSRITEIVRQAIVNGTYPAGSQLPNQLELARRFGVSGFTVHQALTRLEREGFIRKRQRLGTHVVDAPPHLTNLALVFPSDPQTTRHYSKFYQCLGNVARAYESAQGRTVVPFYGVNWHADAKDRQRLIEQVQAHQFAGIIFASPVDMLVGTPIADEPGVPRVAVCAPQKHKIPVVTTDMHSFLLKALDYLAARGRKRIAMVCVKGVYADDDPDVAAALAARGQVSPPYWRPLMAQSLPEGVRNVVRLLMHGAGGERPDGLIVCDDNLVEDAQAGLVAAGVSVGTDLDVVEHGNFPWPRSVLPTRRLGFDSRRILRVCTDLIDRQRRGETVPAQTWVAAEFEDELAEEAT